MPPKPLASHRSGRPVGGQQSDSLGGFAVNLIQSLGGRPTPGATKFFRAWQQREGGWTANQARYNPLNLTAPGSGLPTINSVGVVAMPSMQAGVQRTANLLRSGYPALAEALRTGQVDFRNPAVQADLNRWVSGNRKPGMSSYVSGIAQAFGQNVPMPQVPQTPNVPGASQLPAPAQMRTVLGPPHLDPVRFGKSVLNQFIQGGGRIDLSTLPQTQQASFVQSPLKQLPTETVQAKGLVDPGGDLQDPQEGNAVTRIAGTQIGKPYVFGSGPSTASFDCSDLIQWSYGQMGIKLPRTTFDQVKMGQALDVNNPGQFRPGDLIFPSPHHVVMYVGDGKVIAAPHTGTVVQYQPLASFGKLYAARRILR